MAVYFGAVGVRNTRHTLPACLLADIAGILLLIPPVRGRLIARVRNWLGRQVEGGAIRVVSGPDGAFDRGGGDGTLGREIIVEEGERDGR